MLFQQFNYLEDDMGFKKMDNSLGFAPVPSAGATGQADLALASRPLHNPTKTLSE